jgi:uroporphyrinogen-III synthase
MAHWSSGPSNTAKKLTLVVRDDSSLDSLHGLASRMAAAAPLSEVLADVVEIASSVATCDSCLVYLLEGDELVLRASKNLHPDAVDRVKLKIGQGITGWVAEHRQPVSVPEKASADPRFKRFNQLPEDRYEAFLSVPVLSRGRVVGVINLQNMCPYQYSEREIGLLSMIGFLVGAEIEMARLENVNTRLSEQLEMRKRVERAKGILQRELGLSEEGAYQILQRESQQRRVSMREIADAILLSRAIIDSSQPSISGETYCSSSTGRQKSW